MKRSKITPILLGGLMNFTGCNSTKLPTIYPALANEFRKHGPWITEIIQDDYRARTREKLVELRFLNPKEYGVQQQIGGRGIHAVYRPYSHTIVLPPPNEKGLNENSIDAVDHEAWHAFFDNGEETFLKDPRYSGPSLEEIISYCEHKLTTPEFKHYHEAVEVIRLNIEINFVHTTWTHANNIITYCHNLVREADRRYVSELSSSEELSILSMADANLRLRSFALTNLIHVAETFEESIHSASNRDVFSLSERRKLAEQGMTIAHETDWNLRTLAFDTETYCDERARLHRRNSRDLYGQNTPTQSVGIVLDSLNAMHERKKSLHTQAKGADEIMARLIDSMYSLYYGPVTYLKFPRTEQDRQFLSRFKWKGKMMFRKGIERDRIGMLMIAQGKDPDVAKHSLEYATTFAWGGDQFYWPANDFTLRGEIPYTK